MMEKEGEKPRFEKIGIFHLVRYGPGAKQRYVGISGRVLRKWKEMGYNIDDLYVAQVLLENGVLALIPLKEDQIEGAIALGFPVLLNTKLAIELEAQKR